MDQGLRRDRPEGRTRNEQGGWRLSGFHQPSLEGADTRAHGEPAGAKIYFRAPIDSLASIALESNRDERR